jgi:galactokinase
MDDLAGRLEAAGMDRAAAAGKGALFEDVAQSLARRGVSPALALFVPGRIEVLGKHTDYAGGRSLLCAVERGFCLLGAPRADTQVRVVDAATSEEASFNLDPGLVVPEGTWAGYPMAVARRLARNFPAARTGADVGFASDLPPAAGMSSSSALLTGVFLILAAANDLESHDDYRRELRRPEDLAGYLGCIENGQSFGALEGDRGVGTFGGSEDHTSMLCCRPGHLSQYSFCPVRHERTIPWPGSLSFVIGVSGVVAAKTGAARDQYNRVALAAQAILELWRAESGRVDPTLAAAASSSPDAPDRIREVLAHSADARFDSRALLARFNQFMLESVEIVPAVGDALAAGDIGAIGPLSDRSQRSAEKWLGNQVPETITLARLAREDGAAAASTFGAGFGGSVWAVARSEDAEAFSCRWEASYRARYPEHVARMRFFVTRPGPPAVRLL